MPIDTAAQFFVHNGGINTMMPVQIRQMIESDITAIYDGLYGHDVSMPRDFIERCWKENQCGDRVTFLALLDDSFVGWGHAVFNPEYLPFTQNNIPEIQNFDVIPPYRKHGVGSQLIQHIEDFLFEKYDVIGIGVGLHAGYGTAQRLYAKRGYIPDGRGVMYNNSRIEPGDQVLVDNLGLYMTKVKPR